MPGGRRPPRLSPDRLEAIPQLCDTGIALEGVNRHRLECWLLSCLRLVLIASTKLMFFGRLDRQAGMAELADAADSKSADRKVVGVRPPLPAPQKQIFKARQLPQSPWIALELGSLILPLVQVRIFLPQAPFEAYLTVIVIVPAAVWLPDVPVIVTV